MGEAYPLYTTFSHLQPIRPPASHGIPPNDHLSPTEGMGYRPAMAQNSGKTDPIRVLIDNRRVRHEFLLDETFEAGMVLFGSEVKSLRAGNATLGEAWIRVDERGAALVGCHIAHYVEANRQNHETVRDRRLLLHHHELTKMRRAIKLRGMTVVPVRLYLKGSLLKIEIALAKGKKLHDKRETLRERDAQREMSRARRIR